MAKKKASSKASSNLKAKSTKKTAKLSRPIKKTAAKAKKTGAVSKKAAPASKKARRPAPAVPEVTQERGKKLSHAQVERRFPGFRTMLAENLAKVDVVTGCCLVPNDVGGPPQPVPGVDQQTCQTKLKGVWIPQDC